MRYQIREAAGADTEAIIRLMREFYAIDQYTFDEHRSRHNLEMFIGSGKYGEIWVVSDAQQVVGYAVLALAFSFEYGGLTAFLDELYLSPAYRHQGLGKQLVEFVLQRAKEKGLQSVHLEVEKHNASARNLYEGWGFRDKNRLLLTKPLT
jgi:ribosomal protein S18 acetylase RimI-like enzyme